jgi:hypothetical protein
MIMMCVTSLITASKGAKLALNPAKQASCIMLISARYPIGAAKQ